MVSEKIGATIAGRGLTPLPLLQILKVVGVF